MMYTQVVLARVLDRFSEARGSAGGKRQATATSPAPVSKWVWVKSPEPYEANVMDDPTPTEDIPSRPVTKILDGNEEVSMKEHRVQDAWHVWEDSLRVACRMRRMGEVVVKYKPLGDPMVQMWKLAKEEQEQLEIWRTQYIDAPDGFEDEGMDGGVFGLDGWSR